MRLRSAKVAAKATGGPSMKKCELCKAFLGKSSRIPFLTFLAFFVIYLVLGREGLSLAELLPDTRNFTTINALMKRLQLNSNL